MTDNYYFKPELTFEGLAEWCGGKIIGDEWRHFNIETSRESHAAFDDNGNIWVDGSLFAKNRTPAQMKQIIISGGLKDE